MLKHEYCPVCREVVRCEDYTVDCDESGVCEACQEDREKQIIQQEEMRDSLDFDYQMNY